ncbi:hypothetical protein OROHE_008292 [Orobanche hederae]
MTDNLSVIFSRGTINPAHVCSTVFSNSSKDITDSPIHKWEVKISGVSQSKDITTVGDVLKPLVETWSGCVCVHSLKKPSHPSHGILMAINCPEFVEAERDVCGFVLNMGSPRGRVCVEDRDMMRTIQGGMKKYIQIPEEVEVQTIILRCLDHMEMKDIARPVAFIAKPLP